MNPRSIYSAAPARGWLPWGLFAPVLFLALVVATQLPAELWLEELGFIDSRGNSVGTPGLMAMLLVPFSAWALAVLGWVLFVGGIAFFAWRMRRSSG